MSTKSIWIQDSLIFSQQYLAAAITLPTSLHLVDSFKSADFLVTNFDTGKELISSIPVDSTLIIEDSVRHDVISFGEFVAEANLKQVRVMEGSPFALFFNIGIRQHLEEWSKEEGFLLNIEIRTTQGPSSQFVENIHRLVTGAFGKFTFSKPVNTVMATSALFASHCLARMITGLVIFDSTKNEINLTISNSENKTYFGAVFDMRVEGIKIIFDSALGSQILRPEYESLFRTSLKIP